MHICRVRHACNPHETAHCDCDVLHDLVCLQQLKIAPIENRYLPPVGYYRDQITLNFVLLRLGSNGFLHFLFVIR